MKFKIATGFTQRVRPHAPPWARHENTPRAPGRRPGARGKPLLVLSVPIRMSEGSGGAKAQDHEDAGQREECPAIGLAPTLLARSWAEPATGYQKRGPWPVSHATPLQLPPPAERPLCPNCGRALSVHRSSPLSTASERSRNSLRLRLCSTVPDSAFCGPSASNPVGDARLGYQMDATPQSSPGHSCPLRNRNAHWA
jgi:hypothetical protein